MAWAVSSLSAAAARHYLVNPIFAEHPSLEKVVVSDVDGQGMLCMDRDELVELRKKPTWECLESKIKIWYAPVVELSCGVVLKGVMLVAILPSNGDGGKNEEEMGLGWIEKEFDDRDGVGMYEEVVRLLLKERPTVLRYGWHKEIAIN